MKRDISVVAEAPIEIVFRIGTSAGDHAASALPYPQAEAKQIYWLPTFDSDKGGEGWCRAALTSSREYLTSLPRQESPLFHSHLEDMKIASSVKSL